MEAEVLDGPPGPPEAPEVGARGATAALAQDARHPYWALVPASADRPQLLIRELDPLEFPQLSEIGLFKELGGVPDMTHSRVLVAQEAPPDEQGRPRAGRIIAYWTVFDAVHVEPLYIEPGDRGRPALAKGLWEGVREVLRSTGAPLAFACIGDADLPAGNEVLVRKLGFHRVPGQLFFVEVQEDGKPSAIGELARRMGLPSDPARGGSA